MFFIGTNDKKAEDVKRHFGLTGRESGQGTIEYILVLVIGIILILSLVYQFHDSFRIWANNFFDGYIKCLLEVGELPGGSGSICTAEYKDMANNGKGLLKDNLAGGGGGDSKGKGGGGKNASKDSKRGGGGGGEVTAPNNNSTVGRFGQDGGRNRSTNLGAVEKGDAAGAGKEAADGGETIGSFSKSYRPDRSRIDYGGYVQEVDEEAKSGKPAVATAGKSNDGNALKPRSFIENLQRKPTAVFDEEGKGLTFGGFIRMLIIIIIIIGIVIFLGGQIMSIAKSREKGGDG